MYSFLSVIIKSVLAFNSGKKIVLINSSHDEQLPHERCQSLGLEMVEATSENFDILISKLSTFGVESAAVSGWNGVKENLVLRKKGSALAPYDKYTNNASHAFCYMTLCDKAAAKRSPNKATAEKSSKLYHAERKAMHMNPSKCCEFNPRSFHSQSLKFLNPLPMTKPICKEESDSCTKSISYLMSTTTTKKSHKNCKTSNGMSKWYLKVNNKELKPCKKPNMHSKCISSSGNSSDTLSGISSGN